MRCYKLISIHFSVSGDEDVKGVVQGSRRPLFGDEETDDLFRPLMSRPGPMSAASSSLFDEYRNTKPVWLSLSTYCHRFGCRPDPVRPRRQKSHGICVDVAPPEEAIRFEPAFCYFSVRVFACLCVTVSK
jgi:hypothetical protein